MDARRRLLSRLSQAHRALLDEARAHREQHPALDIALSLGAGVRVHQVMVELIPDSLRSVADEGLIEALGVESRRLEENLDFLKSMSETEPRSPDVGPLSAALVERIREHLERSDRALFRPLEHLYREAE
jgi:hypothetical protein